MAGDWIVQVCYVFHWTADYVLAMPVNRFFLFLEKSYNMQGMFYSQLADLHAIASVHISHYVDLKKRYNKMAGILEDEPEFKPIVTDKPVAAKDETSRAAVFAMLHQIKRESI